MVLILHIETSIATCSVALSKDGICIACKEEWHNKLSHGELLTSFIQEVLTSSSYDISELSAISVASGPGSYTGLRIGVSTAKGLCYSLQIPLISIDSLDSLIEVGRGIYPSSYLAAFFDARRSEVFGQIRDNKNTIIQQSASLVLDETSFSEYNSLVVIGDSNDKLKLLFKERNFMYDDEIHTSAKGQVRLAFGNFNQQKFEDLAYFEPKYIKEFYDSRVVK
jgi:tRNA threonylcarbamoyladenosine biosynthesis protein TsaB